MKIKIKKVYEEENVLRVEVETAWGIDNFGLGLDKKKMSQVHEVPKWQLEVKSLLEKKYGHLKETKEKALKEYNNTMLKI